ncbi:hypothetical protein INQ51_08540 [Maribellus sp. CM-23]|uniref:hypothetical protein n=1 Tax=Maribellus sp. CM-23 TaxID=2781026 RepID=UPI001F48E67C|nr:hypothetical protein [Maribellus sp. CM-23]MCE4564358.1 hypothetical protein [Maribellus sp. CM-23]
MKIIASILAFVLAYPLAMLITSPLLFVIQYIKKEYSLIPEPPKTFTGIIMGGIESVALVLMSIWVFSWFDLRITLLYVVIITVLVLINNINRYNTRPFKEFELGVLLGDLVGIPLMYFFL